MSKPMKNAIVQQVTKTLEGHDSAVFVNPGRMTVHETEHLRSRFRSEGVTFLHLRNRLGFIALEKVGMTGVDSIISGPAGIAFGGEGAIAISKIVMEEAKSIENLEVLGGFMDGEVIDKAGVAKLSTMPGKKELQAMVLHSFFGPVSDFAGSMNNLLTEVHGLIDALAEKGGAES